MRMSVIGLGHTLAQYDLVLITTVYWFAKAAITKYHKVGDVSNQNYFLTILKI